MTTDTTTADSTDTNGSENPYVPDRPRSERMIDDIQRVDELTDDAPRKSDYDTHGKFTPAEVAGEFGCWTDALREAGIDPDPDQRQRVTDEALLSAIRDLAAMLGREPTFDEMADYDKGYHPHTYAAHFGSWSEAKEIAFSNTAFG